MTLVLGATHRRPRLVDSSDGPKASTAILTNRPVHPMRLPYVGAVGVFGGHGRRMTFRTSTVHRVAAMTRVVNIGGDGR